MDPSQMQGGTPDGAHATGAAGAASSQQQADAGAAQQGQRGAEPFLSKSEFVEYAKRVQKLEERNKALEEQLRTGGKADAAAEKKTDAPSETQQLRRELALKEAAVDHGLTAEQRKRLERLYAAEQPPDIAAWAKATVEEFGWKKAEDDGKAGQKGQQQRQIRTDLGASGRQDGAQPPDDWTQMDPATWKSLTPEERRKRVDAHKRASGYSGGTFRKPLPK